MDPYRNVKELKMSDLPSDLAEEVLSRVPVKSMRAVRLGCKKWNILSRNRRFTKRQLGAATEFQMVMVMDFKLYLMRVNLHNDADPSINHQGKLVSLTDSDQLEISIVCHCDGLLLCIREDNARFAVWNPYCLQIRWFEPITCDRTKYHYRYAIGYENISRKYKILRFYASSQHHIRYEIYYVNSKRSSSSSSVSIPITMYSDWEVSCYARGVSVKGNTYWFAQEKIPRHPEESVEADPADFLICFDFTTERFGPRLRLPFHSCLDDTVTLSSIRDEQLAVLFQNEEPGLHMEIWITTKIEPDAVSWGSKVFLSVDMYPLIGRYLFPVDAGSFFVDEDEEKKVAVVFDKGNSIETRIRNVAYIIGEDGYFKKVDFGEAPDEYTYPSLISYVPSLAQIIKPPARRGAKRKKPNC